MARVFKYQIDDDFGYSTAIIKGERRFFVEGYASTTDRDKAGEVIALTAQEDIYNQILNENITMDLEHEQWYAADGHTVLAKPRNDKIPVAKVVDAKLTEKGVWIKAELNQHLSSFQELWGSIKDGFLKAFSVAFYPVEKASDSIIKRLNLVNITLTGSPVNPQATFSATMKSASAYLASQTHLSPTVEASSSLETIKTNEVLKMETPEIKAIAPETPDSPKPKEKKEKKEDEDEKSEEDKKEDKKEAAKEEAEGKPKVKAEEPQIDIQAELKAIKEQHEATIKALNEEIAKLKAELEKPVMKAIVEEVPKIKAEFKHISPLELASRM